MTPKDTPTNFTLATDPMLANIDEVTEKHCELVFIYGFIGKVTDETVRLYQGLELRAYYEIPRRGIVFAEKVTCPGGPSTKLVLYSTTRITYVSSATVTLPASSLAKVVADHRIKSRPAAPCRVGCLCNGVCICADMDYWLHLDENAARKLGVETVPSRTT
jgi:hypothetical protein